MNQYRILLIEVFFLIYCLTFIPSIFAAEKMGLGELDRLIKIHKPQKPTEDFDATIGPIKSVQLLPNFEPTVFSIPGFKVSGCGACHQSNDLLNLSIDRMRKTLKRLHTIFPDLSPAPLKQFIIQSWSGELLQPWQFAHTTFDSIRISPATILIDSRAYGNATHLHESLHLTQPFVGAANELEAYGLNIRSDPRFLFLNFPYFSDTVTAFFLPEFPKMLDRFFARQINEDLTIPREVQWFLMPFDEESLKKLSQAIKKMEPVLKEMGRMNRKFPVKAAYLGEQTRALSLLLDIAAAKLLPLPKIMESDNKEAFSILGQQFDKLDNTRLGYRIDRKREALMILTYKMKIKDPQKRLGIYFHFLKDRYVGADGEISLKVSDEEDLKKFVEEKRVQITRMMKSKNFTEIERQGAEKLLGVGPTGQSPVVISE
ncbi:MAG TPA: hypothetical protein HPP54_00990 [Nitrospinae bacterium]|nr:hypothetical protein [Nitrospinota bacterium]